MDLLAIPFTVRPSSVEEPAPEGGIDPYQYVLRSARHKAEAVAQEVKEGLVIGADTIVVVDQTILGKPRSPEEAWGMLERLSGRSHFVLTALCVIQKGEEGEERRWEEVVSTEVWFYPLTAEEIERYVATGEPMDKAGAYAIQGQGAMLIEKILGDFFNVVGLPVARLARILAGAGVPTLVNPLPSPPGGKIQS